MECKSNNFEAYYWTFDIGVRVPCHTLVYHNSLPGTSSVGGDSLLVDIGMDLERASQLESCRRGGAATLTGLYFGERELFTAHATYIMYILVKIGTFISINKTLWPSG